MPVNNSVKKGLELIEKDTSKVLGLTVGKNVVTPGMYIPKAEAQSPPELPFAAPSPSATYLVIGLDIDAPFPAFGPLGPILHWIQPGLKASPSTSTLTSNEPFVANYIGPAPPPFGGAHRYIFFLYEQPAGFDGKQLAPPGGKKLGNGSRMRFDLDAFEKKEKLGPILAVNYFKSN
ncbi:phosphatidylethanolamine-binding protein-like protein [Mollisia scopiformis]|uniref:Phosphatidylethanolamine-binding protein-like protein n=1 Tax=Mollisia scopiformis TaxID=149040 RepID=A0A194XA68_MOLSC|nr:phosphatidylethanolamine-binding protein-like protein [Mollisia scopiformis]KUJ17066.1 phosphatidylethanolamine-binding protein-like protein [Mollisia scopiformis]